MIGHLVPGGRLHPADMGAEGRVGGGAGARHLPGQWPDEPAVLFESEGTVTTFEQPPEGERPPDYPPP